MVARTRNALAATLALTLLPSLACRSSPRLDGAAGDGGLSHALSGSRPAYPWAPWRARPWSERDGIVLWVSHILVSHRDAFGDPTLRPVSWKPDARPERSRDEAQALASRLAERAAAHPESFEDLAKQYSDDDVTRAAGGSLGGVRATQLPGEFLDALTALRPGDVSGVVETSLGFHILLRRSPPPHEDVAGRRVVVRYAGTLDSIGESPSARTRDEARDLANSIADRARDGTVPFASLVHEYSEHADRVFDGDIGLWSTLAPDDKPREVETLSRLKIGEIAPPVDSLWGVQVLQRVEPSSRGRYAMAAVRLRYGPALPPSDPGSRQSVSEQARSLARELHRAPSTFAEVQGRYENAGVETWESGHGSPQVTSSLQGLRFGEVASEPVAIPFFFVVAMRLDPALVVAKESEERSYELPMRATPDLEALFHDVDAARLSPRLAEFMRPEIPLALRLTAPEAAAFRAALDALQKDVPAATTGDARVQSYRSATKRLHETLSEASYSRVMDFIEREAGRMVLANR